MREYSIGHKPSNKDIQEVSEISRAHGYVEKGGKPIEWFKEEGMLDFICMRLHEDEKKLVFSSCLLPGPTLYVYPGPKRWKKGKDQEVDMMVSSLRDRGLNLTLMSP